MIREIRCDITKYASYEQIQRQRYFYQEHVECAFGLRLWNYL